MSQAIQPGLDISPFREQLEALKKEAQTAGIADAGELINLLSEKHKFTGNSEDYYSVDNSLLDKVLITRTGIPISLALIYICTGNSPGLSVYGISFPGHFLVGVKPRDHDDVTLIDPFAPRIVSRAQCYQLIEQLYQRNVSGETYFEPADKQRILLRLIENIKGVYLQLGNTDLALTCLDHQLMIAPEEKYYLSQQQKLLVHLQQEGGTAPSVH